MVNSRLSVAIHILSLLATHPHDKLTSEFMAASVQTNPVVIRRISGMLRKGGLIKTQPGISGAFLMKKPENVTLLDIYHAVFQEEVLFTVHANPNPACPVGKQIQQTLDDSFERVENAMKNELANQTLQDVIEHLII
ncbi:DNA-binding IscR family transcriptional regulator [Salibacterium salarium]|uniref:Rrf2 family transcriptional regulator n=1 Tax=Salibacterium salarium TaxID=284579 RepID=UPI002781BEFD|nr:Rrf2 family transcriptional regulator [Salibacterium salarium]MDQ0300146.1 DNA-binding IscR family transcriptional regulator [Salibacterium salarium]